MGTLGGKPPWWVFMDPQVPPKWAAQLRPRPPWFQETMDPVLPEICSVKESRNPNFYVTFPDLTMLLALHSSFYKDTVCSD